MLELLNVVNISVSQAPVGLGAFNVNNLALFTSESPDSPFTDGYRVYVSPAAVAADFGTDSETYEQAVAVFSQSPNLLAGGGRLIVFTMEATAEGAIKTFEIDAVGSGYALGNVLTVVQAGGSLGTLTVTDVDENGAILAASLTTAGSGYAVAGNLATTVAPSGGTGCKINLLTVSGAVETLEEAIARTVDVIFYVGIISTDYPSSDGDREDLADAVQAYGDKVLFLPSATSSDIAGVFTDIKDASDYNTRCLYYGNDDALEARLMGAAYASRAMAVNYDGSNTSMTMNLKSLATIDADDSVDQTLYTSMQTAGVDGYVSYAGVSCVVSNGANRYTDQVLNLIWFVAELKVKGFNALRQLSTKIPQTENGMSLLKGAYRKACEQAVTNGYVAPGQWNSAEWFGNQEDMNDNILQRGYYIYSAPVNLQSQEDREAREAPLIQIAIKEAGAIHSTSVIVNINA